MSDDAWPDVFALANAAAPWADNLPWLQNRREFAQSGRRARYYLACDSADVSRGFGAIEEAPWSTARPPNGWFRVFVVLEPGLISDLGAVLLDRLRSDAATLHAIGLWVREETRDPILEFFREQGFRDPTAFQTEDGAKVEVLKMHLVPAEDRVD